MASHYQRGAAFERRVAARLTRDGYHCIRAAGSKGAADIIALKPSQVLLVQVKRTNPLLPRPERIALVHLACVVGGLPIVAYQSAPRKPLSYRVLTGIGPKEFAEWTPDQVGRPIIPAEQHPVSVPTEEKS